MKEDIKKLYYKDKNLAIKAAKALGYKIVAVKELNKEDLDRLKFNLKNAMALFKDMSGSMKAIEKNIKKLKIGQSFSYTTIGSLLSHLVEKFGNIKEDYISEILRKI